MMKKSKIIVLTTCFILFFALSSTVTAEEDNKEILKDNECDVYDLSEVSQSVTGTGGMDELENMNLKTTCKPNIDIRQISCEKNNNELSVDFEIDGELEDGTSMEKLEELGELLNNSENIGDAASSLTQDIIQVQYMVVINTTHDQYTISYTQGNCTLSDSKSITSFMTGGTGGKDIPYEKKDHGFSVTVEINQTEEVTNISAYTVYIKMGLMALFGGSGGMEYYMDIAPNPGFTASAIANPKTAKVGEEIQFSSSVIEGEEPYEYEWTFGDGTVANEQNPTHKYSKEGIYKVSLTVTDSLDNTTKSTIEVNVTNNVPSKESVRSSLEDSENSENGLLAVAFGENSGLLTFIALVAAILVVGVAVLYYISKR